MDVWEDGGRLFEITMASNIIRDGMALELTDLDAVQGSGPALEIFFSDIDHTMTFSAMRPVELSMEVLTRFVETARRRLPPE